MQRVTGLGGVFLKADDPERMYEWYERHLGVRRADPSAVIFPWRHHDRPEEKGETVFSFFPRDSTYFDPSRSECMLNFRVDDLDALLAALSEEGVTVDERREDAEYGRFAWILDPEGNRIELWQPPQGDATAP